MFSPNGKFGWYELMTSDAAAATSFYTAVVGWKTTVMSNPGGPDYHVFLTEKLGVAGMLEMPGHTAWIGYIEVADVDAHVEKIQEAGGKLLRPTVDVPNMLRFAVVADPQGAAFVVFTPVPMVGAPARPQPPTQGTFGWAELYTTDLDAGFDFYQSMFGWTKMTDMDMGPMGLYRIFNDSTNAPMGAGGMMLKGLQIPVPCWGYYICVDSVGAAKTRVESAGGTVVNGPMPIPGGGFILQGMDPQGAMFALTGPE